MGNVTQRPFPDYTNKETVNADLVKDMDSVKASLADIATNPSYYGAKGDGIKDDTVALQQALNNFLVVDLKGKSYVVSSTLNLKSYQLILNGKLIARNLSPVLYGNNVNNVTIQNVEIDGQNSSEKGIFIWTGNNILVDNCNIHDLKTINDNCLGIYLKSCTFSKIARNSFTNFVGTPNGTIGDILGTVRAILLEKSTSCIIDFNNISNIYSSDDGDGIHLIDADAGYSISEIETDSLNVISNNFIKNVTRSAIKIQQSGVLISHNDLLGNDVSYGNMDNGLRIYGSNITISDNRIECNTSTPIILGNSLNIILKNIVIRNNFITWNGTAFQAAIVMNNSQSIENVLIDGNNIIPTTTSESGVYIRTYVKNIRIINNKMVGVVNGIYIRNISGITPTTGSAREKCIIANNDVESQNNLVYEESTNIYDGLVVTNNHLKITAPLSYAQNSVRLSNQQLNNNPVISGNRIVNNGFSDGWLTIGSTTNRPTVPPKAFKFFDTTLNKPVWCKTSAVLDGSGNVTTAAVWVDATGTVV